MKIIPPTEFYKIEQTANKFIYNELLTRKNYMTIAIATCVRVDFIRFLINNIRTNNEKNSQN